MLSSRYDVAIASMTSLHLGLPSGSSQQDQSTFHQAALVELSGLKKMRKDTI